MYKELRKEAKKKVKAKMAFYICAIVFSFTSVVLIMLSFYLPSISFWLRLPIPIFVMVLAIIYLATFGLPSNGVFSDDWEEEEIEREVLRMYRQRKQQLPPIEELSEKETLELKELERLRNKDDWDKDFV